MSSVTFSGLASGVDTASIVESIMEIERTPITTMEDQQEYLEAKLEVYTEFNTLLDSFYSSVLSMNSSGDLTSFDVVNNGSDYFSISTGLLSDEGTYAIEVVDLAQQQKDISEEGFATPDETTLTGELQFGDETLTYEDVTLTELVDLIAEGDYGITASITDVGTEDGYHLLLTADTAGEEIEITGTGSIVMDTSTDSHTVDATQAHFVIDGIDYYSSDNTVTTAIPGTTITLLAESDSVTENVSITSDTDDVIATQLEELVTAYNSIAEYVETIADTDPTLANSMRNIQRNLKDYLTGNDLIALGIESDWETGELSLDTEILTTAWENDPNAVTVALLGDDDSEGIMARMDEYMSNLLSSSTGFFATRESSIDTENSRLDDRIAAMETRLEKRQETLESQFLAMELLVSSLNSQGDYLTSFFEDYSSSS